MNIKIPKLNIQAVYNEDGVIEHVIDLRDNSYLIMDIIIEGAGFKIEENKHFLKTKVCDARYLYIKKYDVFIPRLIYVLNKED